MAQPKTDNKSSTKGLNITICGGGIIGVCTAYFLSQKPNISSITIIERYKIAGCASGKAGGFLAYDWCDGGLVESLARKSYTLHKELAQKYGNKYLYRPTIAYSVNSKFSKDTSKSKKSKVNDLQWMDCSITNSTPLGSKNTNAQLHPRLFCETLVNLMQHKLTIKYGAVTRMKNDKSEQNKIIAVEYIPNSETSDNKNNDAYQGSQKWEEVSCDAVVIAMGPWSIQAYQWFPECKHLQYITGSKANSVVIEPTFENDMKNNDENDMNKQSFDGSLFLKHKDKNGGLVDIEVYPRPDGSVYSCCHSNKKPLPNDPSTIMNDENDSQMIYKGLQELSSKYTLNAKLVTKQACYLPASFDNIPLIGQITGSKNAFIGTGHTCWGILNAPATGLVLAELIADGKVTSIKQNAFDKWSPSRDLF